MKHFIVTFIFGIYFCFQKINRWHTEKYGWDSEQTIISFPFRLPNPARLTKLLPVVNCNKIGTNFHIPEVRIIPNNLALNQSKKAALQTWAVRMPWISIRRPLNLIQVLFNKNRKYVLREALPSRFGMLLVFVRQR